MTRLLARMRPAFAVGGPLFNLALVALLMTISFLAVALPERDPDVETGAAPTGLAFAESGPTTTTASTTTGSAPVTTPPTTPTTTPPSTFAPPSGQIGLIGTVLDDMLEAAREPSRLEPSAATPEPPAPEEIVRIVYRTEPAPATPPRPECTDHPSRAEAQVAFDADPVELAHFDGDGDGNACEHIADPSDPLLAACDAFTDQPEAQILFDSDPMAYAHMDGDGDGRACEQLPGAPPEIGPAPPPPPVLTTREVRRSTDVFGLHTREAPWWMGELDYVTRLIGKAPNSLLFFSNWSRPFPAEEVASAWNRGMTPHVAWEPVVPGADAQPKLADIAAGLWDPYIDSWAAGAAAHGQPIVLRFAAEMNGSWYPWSETGFGNAPGEFAPAWRRVHDRFEAAGATNVVWLWSVNRVDNLSTDIAGYWPGAEYVDWLGISGYWRGYQAAAAPTFDAIFGRTLGELRALSGKPIVLAEMGAGGEIDADRVGFLDSVFAGLAANPDIIGFVYFNDRKAGGDWRVQFSQNMVDAFAAGVADQRWRTGVLPPGMDPGERLAVPAFGDPDVDLGNPDG